MTIDPVTLFLIIFASFSSYISRPFGTPRSIPIAEIIDWESVENKTTLQKDPITGIRWVVTSSSRMASIVTPILEVIKNPTDEPKINPRPIPKKTDSRSFVSIPNPS